VDEHGHLDTGVEIGVGPGAHGHGETMAQRRMAQRVAVVLGTRLHLFEGV
jgi:hypothetical protein